MVGSSLSRRALAAACGFAAALAWAPARAAAPVDAAPDLRTFHAAVAPFFEARCGGCHGAKHQKGDLRLDTIDGGLAQGHDAARWKEVYDRLSAGEMPPKGEPRPAAADVDKVVAWIVGETRKAERAARSTGGRVLLRRMNRAEYANTVRDLLHVRFPLGDGPLELLPPDGSADGFDKVGGALTLDPSLMAAYLAVARRVADAAIVSGPRPFEVQRRRFEYEDTARSIGIGYLCKEPHILCRARDVALLDGSTRTWEHLHFDAKTLATIPVGGEYTIRVRMSAELGARGEPLKVQLLWPSDTVIAEWTLGKDAAAPRVYEITLPIKVEGKSHDGPEIRLVNGTPFYPFNDRFGARHHDADVAAAAGDAAKAARLVGQARAEGDASSRVPSPAIYDRERLPKVALDWIEIEGPLLGEWPPASHRAIFSEGAAAKPDLGYARRIFERLMPRAYRRPVTVSEVDATLGRVSRELAAGESFEEAVRVGLEYVLCSPQFIYLAEPQTRDEPRPLDDYELGSRLSYFLWSSLPDDELTRLAAAHELRRPGAIAAQVQRMLRDEKARAFVDGFAAEWLQAPRFVNIKPNHQIYKDWDDALEAAVKREPLAFFSEIVRADLSVLDFLDSDFAMLNGRLARLYGIGGVEGDAFRRVPLPPGSARGGLVTQAAILTIGSDGTRTMPVRRAAWVLGTLFNEPPPPPPPNVREIEPNVGGKQLTVRERLLAHQQVPACASCHRRIDAYGLALESYGAVGEWRARQDGEGFFGDGAPAIDASGTLADGRSFRTTAEFRALLRADRDRFCRALVEKMLTYALGRGVEASDADTVAAVGKALAAGQYKMSALVTAIAESQAFGTR
jgi:hypothetical protein